MTRLDELRRGWLILAACTMALGVSVAVLPIYSAGVFMTALNAEFGWSFGAMSLAPALISGIAALTAPMVGALVDRIGPKILAPTSLILSAVVYWALSEIPDDIRLFWLGYAVLAFVGAGCATVTLSKILATQFCRSRGAAMAIAMTGIGITSVFAPALIQQVISQDGWRSAYLLLAAILLAAAPVIGIPLRMKRMETNNPNRQAEALSGPSATIAEAVRTPVFWMMAIAFPLISLAQVGMIVHFVPMLTLLGVSTEQAALQAGAIGVAVIACRLLIGALIDRVFSPYVAAAAMLLSAIGLAIFVSDPVSFGVIGALAVGLAIGAEFDLIGYMASRYFGIRSFGAIYGWLYAVTILAGAVSPLLWGAWADAVGSYMPVLVFAIVSLVIATGLFLRYPPYSALLDREPANA